MTTATFKLWGTYYPPAAGLLAIFPSESEAKEHAFNNAASVVMFEFHGTALSGPDSTTPQDFPEPRTLTWTGTDTSADLIRDAIVETEGKCETRIYRRLTDVYGNELVIDTPQRMLTIKRGGTVMRAADGWVAGTEPQDGATR